MIDFYQIFNDRLFTACLNWSRIADRLVRVPWSFALNDGRKEEKSSHLLQLQPAQMKSIFNKRQKLFKWRNWIGFQVFCFHSVSMIVKLFLDHNFNYLYAVGLQPFSANLSNPIIKWIFNLWYRKLLFHCNCCLITKHASCETSATCWRLLSYLTFFNHELKRRFIPEGINVRAIKESFF